MFCCEGIRGVRLGNSCDTHGVIALCNFQLFGCGFTMHGNRIRLRQQLEKERQELEKRLEEDERIRQRNVIVSQASNTMTIPQKPQPPQVTVEVPKNVLEVNNVHMHVVLWYPQR